MSPPATLELMTSTGFKQAAQPHRLSALPREDWKTFDLIVRGYVRALESGDGVSAAVLPPLAQRARRGLDILDGLGLGEPNPTSEKTSIVLLPGVGATRMTLVFSGNNAEFALPPELLQKGDTHLLLIRDPSRCFALAGVFGLGDDYESCLESLCRINTALGVEQLYVAAISAGAAGGLRFACDLAAYGFLGFSVPTTLDLEDDPGAELRHYPQLTMLYRRRREMGIDLARYYAATLPRPRALLVFSNGHIRDSWLARRMEPIEGTEIIPTIGFDGHTTYHFLVVTGQIAPLFHGLYQLVPISESPRRAAIASLG